MRLRRWLKAASWAPEAHDSKLGSRRRPQGAWRLLALQPGAREPLSSWPPRAARALLWPRRHLASPRGASATAGPSGARPPGARATAQSPAVPSSDRSWTPGRGVCPRAPWVPRTRGAHVEPWVRPWSAPHFRAARGASVPSLRPGPSTPAIGGFQPRPGRPHWGWRFPPVLLGPARPRAALSLAAPLRTTAGRHPARRGQAGGTARDSWGSSPGGRPAGQAEGPWVVWCRVQQQRRRLGFWWGRCAGQSGPGPC